MLSPELLELRRIVLEAGEMARAAQKTCSRELKPDGSIVTNADREVEQFLRGELVRFKPGTNVWGEEFGFAEDGAEGVWLVDPIDGTSNYCFGSPIWGVTVALMKAGEVLMGVITLPALGEDYCAEADSNLAFKNEEPLDPIPAGPVHAHELVSVCEGVLRRTGLDHLPGKPRCAGAFVADAMWMATQRYRGLIGLREKLYDIAASILICEKLGAEIRYLDGEALDLLELKRGGNIQKPWMIFPRESGLRVT